MRRYPSIDCDCSSSLNGLDPHLLEAAQRYLDCRRCHRAPSSQDEQNWTQFFLICDPLLRRFATSCHVPWGDLDDCVQSAWKEIVIALPTFRDGGQLGRLAAWLRHIVHSKAVDIRRYRERHPARQLLPDIEATQVDQRVGPAAELEQSDHRARMQRVLAEMSRLLRATSYRVFQLRCLEGMTVQEVAQELKLSEQQVRYRSHRMRQKFRRLYEQDIRASDAGNRRN